MAGFAVVMTILTFGLIGLILASIASLCLYLYAKKRFREALQRRRVVIASVLVPFFALTWLVVALLLHVQISNRLAHQDCGFSPDPYVTLPNGYVLGSANTYSGYFKAPGFETDVPSTGPGYVRGIIDLQLTNDNFVGTYFDFKTSRIRHFVFDTRSRALQVSEATDQAAKGFQSSNPNDLDKWAAAQNSVHEDADSYWILYTKYRHQWPNYVLTALIVAGEGMIGLWIWTLWNKASSTPKELALS